MWEHAAFTFIPCIQTYALREKCCPEEALWPIRGSVLCSRAVPLIPPLYPKGPTRLPAQSLSTQSEKLCEGAAGIRTMCIQTTANHLKGPSPAAGPNAALRLLSFCAWTRCLWEERLITITTRPGSFLFSLSDDASTPRRPPVPPVATPVQKINVAVRAFIYLAAVPQTRPSSVNFPLRGLSLMLTVAFTDASDNGSAFLQTNVGLWLLNKTQTKADDKTQSR